MGKSNQGHTFKASVSPIGENTKQGRGRSNQGTYRHLSLVGENTNKGEVKKTPNKGEGEVIKGHIGICLLLVKTPTRAKMLT